MYRDINSRGQMGVWEYLCYFFQKFMGTWDTLAGHTYLPRENSTLSSHLGLSSIALTAILVMPFILFLVERIKGGLVSSHLSYEHSDNFYISDA